MSGNGSNPRLDRIERILDTLAKDRVQDRSEFKRQMAEHRAEVKRELADHRAEVNRELAEHKSLMKADVLKTRDFMRRWGTLGVKEARRHRKRIAALEAETAKYQAQSAKYQAHTDERLSEIADKLGGPDRLCRRA